MRNIYKSKGLFSGVTQGSIINNCVANDYKGKEVYGIIITPRCDLDHDVKVSTVHYLPIVSLKDWFEIDFPQILHKRYKKQIAGRLNQWVKENYNIDNFLSSSLANLEVFKTLLTNPALPKNLLDVLNAYYDVDGCFEKALQSAEKMKKSILGELHKGELHNFYLLESWQTHTSHNNYYVVLLREIHQISRDIIRAFLNGFLSFEFDDNELRESSLMVNDSEYRLQAEIASPFIEHILQGFVYNFSRIGVEDMNMLNYSTYIAEL